MLLTLNELIGDISSVCKTADRNGHRNYKESTNIKMKTSQAFFVKETVKEIQELIKSAFPQ